MTPTDPTPHGATWYAATMAAAPERGPLVHDLDVDVCVIGGGLAGLTTARELARLGWSVAVLEARRIAWNASGRNAGFVAPGFSERLPAIVERVGLRRAKELWALSAQGADYVRATISETGMPGVAPVDGRLTVRRTDDEDALLRHVAMLRIDFATEAEAWPTEQVREALRSPLYFQAEHLPGAFHVHPLNYALGLAAAAEQAGARLFEDTPALAIDPHGVRKHIETPKGRIRAGHIVLAAGAHLGALFPLIARTVVPVAGYVATTAPLGERLSEAIRYGGAVADTRRVGDNYRIVDGDRLLWAGRFTARTSTPRQLQKLIRRDIRNVFPQLGQVEIEHAWSGVMSYAVHKMPQIGELAPGLWLAGAFGGHGINTTAMAGVLIARAIRQGDDRWRLFSPYELVWAGGRLGRVAAQAIFWSMQLIDAAEEKLSRYRAAARARAAAKAAGPAVLVAGEASDQPAAQPQPVEHAEPPQVRAVSAPPERDVGAPRASEEAGHRARQDAVQRALEMAAERARALIARQGAGEGQSAAAPPVTKEMNVIPPAAAADSAAMLAVAPPGPLPDAPEGAPLAALDGDPAALEIGSFSLEPIPPLETQPAPPVDAAANADATAAQTPARKRRRRRPE